MGLVVGVVLFSYCDRRGRRPLGCGSLLSVFFFPLLVRSVLSVLSASVWFICLRFGCDFLLWVWFYFSIVIGVGIGLWVVGLSSLFYIPVN